MSSTHNEVDASIEAAPANDDIPKGLCSVGRTRMLGVVLGILVLAVGGFLIVYFTTLKGNKAIPRIEKSTSSDTCDDIAIIAGSYAAWKLRERGLAITMYEYSERIGGRMHTIQFREIPDINVELGAMRFVPPAHPLIVSTAAALNLSVVDFKPGLGLGRDVMFYLRGVHIRRKDLREDNIPYNLDPNEQAYANDPDQLKNTDVAYSTMGASREAVALFRDVTGYHAYSGSSVASLFIPDFIPNNVPIASLPVKTIGEGMDALPKSLAQEFNASSTRNRILFNHKLFKIEKQSDETLILRFWSTETVNGSTKRSQSQKQTSSCGRKVILCIPRQALESLEWDGLRNTVINKLVKHSIKDVPAAKIFLAYDQPWWKGLAKTFSHSVSDLPNRQTYDFGTSHGNNKSVLLAAYMDMDDVKFWRELRSRDTSSSGPVNIINEASLFHVNNMLAKVFNVSVTEIPNPREGVMSLWDEYPFGAGWHVWMPGYNWNDVEKQMIKPSKTEHVYIASNGFTPAYGSSWSESALEVVELVIKNMDAS